MTDTEIAALVERLRKAPHDLRRTPVPLSDYIPMIQEAADAILALQQRVREPEVDARRYRWLRPRLEIRNQFSMHHGSPARPALEVRLGHEFMDSKARNGEGYTDPKRFVAECEQLDAAIDAAAIAEGGK